jgi:hypothetical protein
MPKSMARLWLGKRVKLMARGMVMLRFIFRYRDSAKCSLHFRSTIGLGLGVKLGIGLWLS